MNILHQIYPVKDRKIIVELPDSFSAASVEVIVLPLSQPDSHDLFQARTNEEKAEAVRQFLERDTTNFTAEQKEAYQQICYRLQQNQSDDSQRVAGLFAGLIQVADDFDAPLPDEALFWGERTDEYGVTLPDEFLA